METLRDLWADLRVFVLKNTNDTKASHDNHEDGFIVEEVRGEGMLGRGPALAAKRTTPALLTGHETVRSRIHRRILTRCTGEIW